MLQDKNAKRSKLTTSFLFLFFTHENSLDANVSQLHVSILYFLKKDSFFEEKENPEILAFP